jgi:hypothetical protein
VAARIALIAVLLWAALPPATAPASFHSRLENEVLAEINRARTDPRSACGGGASRSATASRTLTTA